MTLISLLLVMALERISSKDPKWHIYALGKKYTQIFKLRGLLKESSSPIAALLVVSIPALSCAAIILLADSLLVSLVLQIAVLWVCLGCPMTRLRYKQYLQAANQSDFEACSLHSMKFGNTDGDLDKVADQLVFINYRQYAAIIIYFILLGAPGVIFYALLKEMQEFVFDKQKPAISKLLFVIDWVPVRVTAFGFLVVGHFSRATSIWITMLFDTSSSTKQVLASVSAAAEDTDAGIDDCVTKPCTMVRLVKRNISFMLVVLAVLTMTGAVT